MKLRDSRSLKQPELMIIPMIDIMFFLLVFFMLSTMYMVDLKTIPIKLPKQTDIASLTMQAKMEQKNNPRFSIVIRADKDADYGKVITLLDRLKGAGVQRFGLATDVGAGE